MICGMCGADIDLFYGPDALILCASCLERIGVDPRTSQAVAMSDEESEMIRATMRAMVARQNTEGVRDEADEIEEDEDSDEDDEWWDAELGDGGDEDEDEDDDEDEWDEDEDEEDEEDEDEDDEFLDSLSGKDDPGWIFLPGEDASLDEHERTEDEW